MHNVKKLIAAGAVVVGVALPTAAHAQQYPVDAGTATVDESVVSPGGTVVLSGSGFADNATVTITLGSQVLRTVQANGFGAFSTEVTIPRGTAPGTQVLRATGRSGDGTGDLVLSATVRVTAVGGVSAGAGGGSLPRTGAESSIPLGQAGAAAVVIGTGLVLVVRNRRQAADQAPVSADV